MSTFAIRAAERLAPPAIDLNSIIADRAFHPHRESRLRAVNVFNLSRQRLIDRIARIVTEEYERFQRGAAEGAADRSEVTT